MLVLKQHPLPSARSKIIGSHRAALLKLKGISKLHEQETTTEQEFARTSDTLSAPTITRSLLFVRAELRSRYSYSYTSFFAAKKLELLILTPS